MQFRNENFSRKFDKTQINNMSNCRHGWYQWIHSNTLKSNQELQIIKDSQKYGEEYASHHLLRMVKHYHLIMSHLLLIMSHHRHHYPHRPHYSKHHPMHWWRRNTMTTRIWEMSYWIEGVGSLSPELAPTKEPLINKISVDMPILVELWNWLNESIGIV